MTRVSVLPDREAVARHTADALAWRIADARHVGREVHIALAGGTTPQRAYELLGYVEGSWEHVHLWLGDERCVPNDDKDSNAWMVRESLYANARPSPSTLHVVRQCPRPEDSAWLYGLELHSRVPDLVFDVALLGMGEDGHIASLFPGSPVLECAEAPCVAVLDAPKAPAERVTLTLPILRKARFTMLLLTGRAKAEALKKAREHDPDIPAGRLGADLDEIVCDRAAAGTA